MLKYSCMANNIGNADQQRRDMDELRSQIERLIVEQKTLNRRATTLQRRNVQLQELNRIKDEFIAVASHQLRTPATGVKQYLGLLLEGYADPLSKNQKMFLQKADDSNNRQLRIIDDLLQVARIDSETFRLDVSKLDLGQLVYEVIGDMKNKIKRKKQKVIYAPPKKKIMIRGDIDRLRMVIENIIDNAINYSDQNKSISVSVKRQKEVVVVEIKDEGVGIDRSDFPKLFQKFSRIPNPLSVEVGGTGLGLYWASKIARLHNGTIRVKSKVGEGSTFSVILPAIHS